MQRGPRATGDRDGSTQCDGSASCTEMAKRWQSDGKAMLQHLSEAVTIRNPARKVQDSRRYGALASQSCSATHEASNSGSGAIHSLFHCITNSCFTFTQAPAELLIVPSSAPGSGSCSSPEESSPLLAQTHRTGRSLS